MIKRLLSLILCVLMLLGLVACKDNNTDKNNNSTNNYDTLFDTFPSVFITENINSITFYAYYGGGKGSEVPSENMAEIKTWLDSFTIVREATDEDVPPGTNTYYVEIEYSDGTIIKEGLDIIIIDGTRYLLGKEPYPDCFMDIISKTSLN